MEKITSAQRHIHKLVDLGILIPEHPVNSFVLAYGFRFTATYVPNPRALPARNVIPVRINQRRHPARDKLSGLEYN